MTASLDDWTLDREIVLTRVLDHPREAVFAAWTDPGALGKWFAPAGHTCETLEADIREGGRWRFVYRGSDGTRYDNRVTFRQIVAPRLITFDHGSDVDDDPHLFRVTVTFDAQSNGKTVLTLRQLHPTPERREWVVGFGAVEIGGTTLDSLERYLDRSGGGARGPRHPARQEGISPVMPST